MENNRHAFAFRQSFQRADETNPVDDVTLIASVAELVLQIVDWVNVFLYKACEEF